MENSLINRIEELISVLQQEEEKGRVVIMTVDGPMSYDIEELCAQPVDGLLYDLNRDTITTKTLLESGESLPLTRLVNDYAVALVIKHLKKKIDDGE